MQLFEQQEEYSLPPHLKICVNYAEAAILLSLSTATLERLVRRDEIPHHKIGDRVIFNVEELRGWRPIRIGGKKDKKQKVQVESTNQHSGELIG